jgi:hypothetical protein
MKLDPHSVIKGKTKNRDIMVLIPMRTLRSSSLYEDSSHRITFLDLCKKFDNNLVATNSVMAQASWPKQHITTELHISGRKLSMLFHRVPSTFVWISSQKDITLTILWLPFDPLLDNAVNRCPTIATSDS